MLTSKVINAILFSFSFAMQVSQLELFDGEALCSSKESTTTETSCSYCLAPAEGAPWQLASPSAPVAPSTSAPPRTHSLLHHLHYGTLGEGGKYFYA